METIKINRITNQPNRKEVYEVSEMKVTSSGLDIVFVETPEMIFHVNDSIAFDKIVYDQGNLLCVSTESVKITEVVSNHEVICEEIADKAFSLADDSDVVIKKDESNSNYAYYGLKLSIDHGFYPQDLLKIHNMVNLDERLSQLTLYIKSDVNLDIDYSFNELALSRKNASELVYFGSDAFIDMVGGNVCNLDNFDSNYIFFRGPISLSDNIREILNCAEISFNYNNKYLTDCEGNCTLYNINGKEVINVRKDVSSFNVPITFSADENYKSLMAELLSQDKYYESVINGVIPDFIDMEKLRYEPVYVETVNGEEVVYNVKEIEYDFHFRKRKMDDDGELDESWYVEEITQDNSEVWNGIKFDDLTNKSYSGYSSDLLWYLGYTDDDVLYQKNRLAKTFIRILFYSTDNPLTQKLMSYSTVFVDTNELYGKYVKLLGDKDALAYKKDGGEFVKYDGSDTKLSSMMTINDEFNHEKSSDGFYCYLFADDASKNSGETIYMKVEFNHAGYGRTIPMHHWLFDEYKKRLSENVTNYFKFLYVKVKLGYVDGKYVYKFSNEYYDNGATFNFDKETGKLQIVLFEPYFRHV